jgi:hypothetical protein
VELRYYGAVVIYLLICVVVLSAVLPPLRALAKSHSVACHLGLAPAGSAPSN